MSNLRDDVLNKTTVREQEAYLNSLYNEVINTQAYLDLGEEVGADDLIPALVEYFQKKYKPEELSLATLQEIYKNLDAWNPEDKFGMGAYIFRSVQSALMCITFESLDAAIKIMDETCLQYLYALENDLENNPNNKLTQKKREITLEAYSILLNEDLLDNQKATLFCEKIADNQAIFNQEKHPKAILFLKAVAVFTAFCVGAGIGAVFAYQKLFKQKDKEPTIDERFKHAIFKQRQASDCDTLTANEEKNDTDNDNIEINTRPKSL